MVYKHNMTWVGHKIQNVFLNSCNNKNIYTQKRKFLGQKVRETSAFIPAQRAVSPSMSALVVGSVFLMNQKNRIFGFECPFFLWKPG